MAVTLCCLMIQIESCSSSELVDVWNDPSNHDYRLKKLLVIAIRKNPVQRRIWEDAFAGDLSKHGVEASSSYILFPNVLPDTNQIIQTIHNNDFDGILVIRVLHKGAQTHYVESYISSDAELKYNPFRNSYSTYYQEVQHPAYIDSEMVNRHSIEVWVVRNKGRIIWGAISNTPARNSGKDIQKNIADLVIDELVRNNIIKDKK